MTTMRWSTIGFGVSSFIFGETSTDKPEGPSLTARRSLTEAAEVDEVRL